MTTTEATSGEPNMIFRVLDAAYAQVLGGFGVFPSAEALAMEYLSQNENNPQKAAESLIGWQITKAATSGFLTNLGGVATLPISIPANISSLLFIQLRMIAAIAIMGGYDVKSDAVRTLVYVSLVGQTAFDILKDVGIQLGQKITLQAITKLSFEITQKMSTQLGARLLARMGLSQISNLSKLVPVAGGIIGATFDAASTKAVAAVAMKMFIGEPELA